MPVKEQKVWYGTLIQINYLLNHLPKFFLKQNEVFWAYFFTIYNPLRILTLALLKPKKIIQDLWKDKVDWGETEPHQLLTE